MRHLPPLAALLVAALPACAPLVTEGARAPPPASDAPACASPPVTAARPRGSSLVRAFACVEEALAPSGCPITRTTRTLDRAGRVVSERFEVLDPSRIEQTYVRVTDRLVTFTYDAAGRAVLERRDDDLDGVDDEVTRRSFDADGTLRRVETTRGAGDDTSTHVREFDAQGLETLVLSAAGRFREETRTAYDPAGRALWREERTNGRLAARTTWSYRPDGAPTDRVRARADGAVLDETRWRYDDAGRLAAREERDLPDGALRLQRLRVTRFDAAGREVRSAEDYPLDGAEDAAHETDFDAAGRRLRERTFLEGERTSETVYTYAPDGRLAAADTAAPRNGVEVRVRYAPDGSAVSTTVQRSQSRTSVVTRHLDAAGRETLQETDRDGDGAVDGRWTYRFDAAGRPLATESDVDGDGTIDGREAWRYDGAGNLLSTRREFRDVEARETRFDYGCFGR